MATQINCDPCSEDSKYLPAIRYCSDCEERLCKECVEYHSRLKSLKSHHLIDLASTGNKIPPPINKYCDIHQDTLLDFYCTQHDTPCCRACIAVSHRGCDSVIPLDQAAKNVQNSALLFDTIEDWRRLTETVQQLLKNRAANLKSIGENKSVIRQQIGKVKLRLLKQIDDLEKNLLTQLSLLEEKYDTKIKKQTIEISKLESHLTKNKQELDFLKEHGSDIHLYLSLCQFVDENKNIETDFQILASSVEEISIKFDEIGDLNIRTMGSIQEIAKPCTVHCKPMKSSHVQIRQDVVHVKSLNVFEKIGDLALKSGVKYNITDLAVNSENKLLLTNWHPGFPKVYIYRDCKDYESEVQCSSAPYGITVIPDTDTAVVSLPVEKLILFIDPTNMTKGKKVKQKFECWGIIATKDRIVVGGNENVHILNNHGSKLTEVTVGGAYINSLHYDTVNDRLLCRKDGGMCCVTLHGKHVYQYKVSGNAGLAVDHQGHVYLSHKSNEIYRLSSDGTFVDVVLNKEHGINQPYALTFNDNFTKLFVINDKSVSIYSCK